MNSNTLPYLLWPRASHQGSDTAVQPLGSPPKGLMGTFVNLNRMEAMGNVADTARPDTFSLLLRNEWCMWTDC